jgi:hypothetical protein
MATADRSHDDIVANRPESLRRAGSGRVAAVGGRMAAVVAGTASPPAAHLVADFDGIAMGRNWARGEMVVIIF